MQGAQPTSSVRSLLITTGSDGALPLKKGDILAAEVLRSAGGNKVSLKIGGKVIEARSEAQLKAGEKVLLKVDASTEASGGKEIRLKILPRGATGAATEVKAAIEKMMSALNGERMSSAGLSGLKAILTRIPDSILARVPEIGVINRFIRKAGKLSGGDLKELVKGSGLFFESGLKGAAYGGGRESVENLLKGDIKGAILRLLSELKDEELIKELLKFGIRPDLLEEGAEKLLRGIEYHQLQSKLNDTIDIFLTIYWKGLMDASLILSDSKHSGKGDDECSSCTLNLHLDTLGRISAGFLLSKESLYITFLAEKAESAAIIEAASGELSEGLTSAGLKSVNIKTRVVYEIDFASGVPMSDLADGVDLLI